MKGLTIILGKIFYVYDFLVLTNPNDGVFLSVDALAYIFRWLHMHIVFRFVKNAEMLLKKLFFPANLFDFKITLYIGIKDDFCLPSHRTIIIPDTSGCLSFHTIPWILNRILYIGRKKITIKWWDSTKNSISHASRNGCGSELNLRDFLLKTANENGQLNMTRECLTVISRMWCPIVTSPESTRQLLLRS